MNQGTGEITLLVVEDDDIDAEGIKRAFGKLKLTNPLIRAKDGVEALEYLRGTNGKEKLNKPYFVLLDLNMPRMSGLEFLEEIRNDSDLKDSVVLVLTTSSADKDQAAAYDKHVAGYIVKSDIQSSFLDVVEMLNCYWSLVSLPE
mgnify:CR=1 FL=1